MVPCLKSGAVNEKGVDKRPTVAPRGLPGNGDAFRGEREPLITSVLAMRVAEFERCLKPRCMVECRSVVLRDDEVLGLTPLFGVLA